MKQTLRATALLTILCVTSTAFAQCIGSESLSHCTDHNGNAYTVQRIGDTTFTSGTNPNTGSNWNQTSQTLGGTTFHNGTDADGNSWNGTSQRIGDTTIHSGTDSDGNYYNKTCNQYGCY